VRDRSTKKNTIKPRGQRVVLSHRDLFAVAFFENRSSHERRYPRAS